MAGCVDQGLHGIQSLLSEPLVEAHQNDGIVDHDSREPEKPEQGQDRHVDSHQPMAEESTGETKGDCHHNDQRPAVGGEHPSQDEVDQDEREEGRNPVLGCSDDAVREAVQMIGANLLIVDPRKKSMFEVRALARQFIADGPRNCPQNW